MKLNGRRGYALDLKWWISSPRSRLFVPLTLALIVLPLYLTCRTISLDDFDSYSFALALKTFDLDLQQPQPPGFPVYVALGRFFYILIPDAVRALSTLSAVSGVLTVLFIYGLGSAHRPNGRAAAALAALIYALAPVSWLTAGKALSDVPGMMWTLLALWLWVRWRGPEDRGAGRHPARASGPVLAALVTGVALGVRPQNALPIVLLTGGLFARDLVHRRSLLLWIKALAGGIVGILLWLIPTAYGVGGVGAYVTQLMDHAAHVGRADALLGMAQPLREALRIRALALLDTALTAFVGGSLYPPHAVNVLARALLLSAVAIPGFLLADWRRRRTRWLCIWAFSVVAQIFFFETLDRPRLLLPALPPLALLVASGWSRVRQRGGLGVGVLSAMAWLLMLWSMPLTAVLAQVPAPPLQATRFVRDHYPPGQTLVAASGSFRAAQVGLPDYSLVYLYQFDPTAAAAAREHARYVVILDRDQVTPPAWDILSDQGRWVSVEDRTFSRDRRVHTQHDQVRLQVLMPPDLVPVEALALPTDGCVEIGGAEAGRYLGQGWFRPELIAGSSARWAGQTVTTTLRFALPFAPDAGGELRLRLRALAYPAAQTVTLIWDQDVIGTVDLDEGWTEVEVSAPMRRDAPAPVVTLALVHAVARSPQAVTGTSSDTRLLTAAYDWVCVLGP